MGKRVGAKGCGAKWGTGWTAHRRPVGCRQTDLVKSHGVARIHVRDPPHQVSRLRSHGADVSALADVPAFRRQRYRLGRDRLATT
eukprot:3932507-Rhodomonas_salina.4